MNKYRKKPVVIEAMQFDGTIVSASAVAQWANSYPSPDHLDGPWFAYLTRFDDQVNAHKATIRTLAGTFIVSKGDYIIKGVKGEFYPCKPDIFEATYDMVDQ